MLCTLKTKQFKLQSRADVNNKKKNCYQETADQYAVPWEHMESRMNLD